MQPPANAAHGHESRPLPGLPDPNTLNRLADLYKIFGDATRVRMLYLLMQGELCVCELAAGAGMSQSAISHQLRVLKNINLVKYRRAGKAVLYALADDHVKTILAQGMAHINE